MEKETKDRRITFRLDPAEYDRLDADVRHCGYPDMSTYVRSRIAGNLTRVFYDPDMTDTMRAYHEDIRKLLQEVSQIRRRIGTDDPARGEDVKEMYALIKAIYRKVEEAEAELERIKKEAMSKDGNTEMS